MCCAGGANGQDKWQEDQELSLETFDEHAPLATIHDLRAVDTQEKQDKTASVNKSNATSDAKSDENSAETVAVSAAAEDITVTSTAKTTTSRPKRNVGQRTVDVMVEGVGLVKVSKFSLEPDDSSNANFLDKRAARQKEHQNLMYVAHSGRQVAGRDFEHQDVCQVRAMDCVKRKIELLVNSILSFIMS